MAKGKDFCVVECTCYCSQNPICPPLITTAATTMEHRQEGVVLVLVRLHLSRASKMPIGKVASQSNSLLHPHLSHLPTSHGHSIEWYRV